MAVIFKNLLIEEKTDEEEQHILSILNGEYDLSDDVSRRLRRLIEESKRLEVFVKETRTHLSSSYSVNELKLISISLSFFND